MNNVKVYQDLSKSWWVACEVGNESNRATGNTKANALQNLIAKQAPSSEKIKADLEAYRKEIEEEIAALDKVWNIDNSKEEYTKNRLTWEGLTITKLRLEKILKGVAIKNLRIKQEDPFYTEAAVSGYLEGIIAYIRDIDIYLDDGAIIEEERLEDVTKKVLCIIQTRFELETKKRKLK